MYKGLMTLNLLIFSLCQVLDLQVTNISCISLRLIYILARISLVLELSMNGIVCRRRYCTVVRYEHLKSKFDCFLKNRGYD